MPKDEHIGKFLRLNPDEIITVAHFLSISGFKLIFSNLLKDVITKMIQNIQKNLNKDKKWVKKWSKIEKP